MAIKDNKIVTAPVTLREVAQLIGYGGNDLGTLCAHENINMWAKWKPIRFKGVFPNPTGNAGRLTLQDRINNYYGLNINVYESTATADGALEKLMAAVYNGTAPWSYNHPRGHEYNEDFRISDFLNGADISANGYNHKVNWEEGDVSGTGLSVITFGMQIGLGNVDSAITSSSEVVGKDDYLNINEMTEGLDDTILSLADIAKCNINRNNVSATIDKWNIGILIMPKNSESSEKPKVILSGCSVTNLDQYVPPQLTTLSKKGVTEWLLVPFLYYNIAYNQGISGNPVEVLGSLVKENTNKESYCLMLGSKYIERRFDYEKGMTKIKLAGLSFSNGVPVVKLTFKGSSSFRNGFDKGTSFLFLDSGQNYVSKMYLVIQSTFSDSSDWDKTANYHNYNVSSCINTFMDVKESEDSFIKTLHPNWDSNVNNGKDIDYIQGQAGDIYGTTPRPIYGEGSPVESGHSMNIISLVGNTLNCLEDKTVDITMGNITGDTNGLYKDGCKLFLFCYCNDRKWYALELN